MSAVTASIIVGTKHRIDPGIQPRWLLMLHEGRSYAWHLLKLQLTTGDLPSTRPDDPPGVLWQASREQDLIGEMALLLHLFAARTPEVVRAAARTYPLRKQRVDLAALDGRDAEDLTTLLALARDRGRELTLGVTILPGSRLTEEALLGLPDWELNVSHTEVTRDWHSGRQGLVVTDLRPEPEAEPPAAAAHDHDEQNHDEQNHDEQNHDDPDPLYDPAAPRRPGNEGFWGLGWSGQPRPDGTGATDNIGVTDNLGATDNIDETDNIDATDATDATDEDVVQAVHAQNQAGEQSVRRGRFGRRRHRPTIEVERRISLADLFGKAD